MFVVDLLHEFELGVWKATFTHLLRILYAQGGDGIQTLNKRLVLGLTFPQFYIVNSFCSGTEMSLHLAMTQSKNLCTTLQG